MRGVVSFHPVEASFFEGTVGALVAGEKINPEAFVESAVRLRDSEWFVAGYRQALESLLALLDPPPPPAEGSMWDRLRTRLERFDFKPDPLASAAAAKLDPELHLVGRPFLICETAADRVSTIVDEFAAATSDSAREALVLEQLLRVDRELPRKLQPADLAAAPSAMHYRSELLGELKSIYELAREARAGGSWGAAGAPRRSAAECLPHELPWRAVWLHSRAVPCWIGHDVDGLETVCAAAGVEPPGFLAPAWALFSRAADEFPALREALGTELRRERDVGAYVAPGDVGELLAFLNTEGARIIQAAARQGAGPTCTTLLRKIRECAHHAQRHGAGYLEACGIERPAREALEEV